MTRPDDAVSRTMLLAPTVTRRLSTEFTRAVNPQRPARELDGVTARELAVLALITRGPSNHEIGDAVVISGTDVTGTVDYLHISQGALSADDIHRTTLARAARLAWDTDRQAAARCR